MSPLPIAALHHSSCAPLALSPRCCTAHILAVWQQGGWGMLAQQAVCRRMVGLCCIQSVGALRQQPQLSPQCSCCCRTSGPVQVHSPPRLVNLPCKLQTMSCLHCLQATGWQASHWCCQGTDGRCLPLSLTAAQGPRTRHSPDGDHVLVADHHESDIGARQGQQRGKKHDTLQHLQPHLQAAPSNRLWLGVW